MPPPERQTIPGASRDPTGPGERSERLRLLRSSHLIASAVREALEARLLREATPLPLSPSQLRLLRIVVRNGGYPAGRVAGLLGLSPPATTKNIDKLESLGLLFRSGAARDRRTVLVSASQTGRHLVRRYEDLESAALAPVLDDLGATEIEHLAGLLERLAAELLRPILRDGPACMRCGGYFRQDCPLGTGRGGCPCLRLLDGPDRETAVGPP